jgi:hypothetical protein
VTTARDYAALAAQGATASALGSAFISLVEPHPGHEHAYNRWYEDDHYYSTGAMAIPWWFAGRRWVATRELRELRSPQRSAVADPVTTGCYFGTYWITEGHWEDQWAWLGVAVARLRAEGRMFDDRTHVHTAFYDLRGSVRRGPGHPRDFQALDHPFAGVVAEVLDAPPGGRDALERWILEEHAVAGPPSAFAPLCVVFSPRPWPDGELWFENAAVPPDRLLALWFLDADPRACWEKGFAGEADAVAAGGLGRTELVAPFVPTVPGTDRYVDELR